MSNRDDSLYRTLDAIPVPFTGKYALNCESEQLGVLRLRLFSQRGLILLAQRELEIRRDGLLGDFLLSKDGKEICRAKKRSPLLRSFLLEVDSEKYDLSAVSPFSRRFDLHCERNFAASSPSGLSTPSQHPLATVSPNSIFSSRALGEFDVPLTLPVKAFCIWLVLFLWRGAEAAAAG